MHFFRMLRWIDRFIRSVIFAVLMAVITAVYSLICMALWPFSVSIRYRNVRTWTMLMIWLMRVICRMDYRVEGVENIPKNRTGVVLCKHQSAWETFFVQRYFRSATVIVKKELFWVPFFGWGLASIAPIAINRSARKTAMQQVIEQGTECIRQGRWVVVYPEGTRTLPGKVGNYRPGGARLAVAAGAPVLPIAHNAGYFWPKRRFVKRPGIIHVSIGPVIETTGKTAEQVLKEAKTWIENKVREMDETYPVKMTD